MSEKKEKKSKREGTLSNVFIRIDDGSSEVETKPLKVSVIFVVTPLHWSRFSLASMIRD